MSNDLNECRFIGRLGRDVEVRSMPDGRPVASFSLAVGWKSKAKEGVEWVNVVCFDKLAEICAQYLHKGSQVFIGGRYKTEKYDKEGVTHYATKIIADRMQMLGGKRDDDEQLAREQKAAAPATESAGGGGGGLDDDIPFARFRAE